MTTLGVDLDFSNIKYIVVTHPDGVCGLLLGALAPLVRLQLLQALLQLLTVLLLLLKQSKDALTRILHGIHCQLYTGMFSKVGLGWKPFTSSLVATTACLLANSMSLTQQNRK